MSQSRNKLEIKKELLEKKLKENPIDINSILSLGIIIGIQGDHKTAEEWFKKGIDIDSDNPTLKFNYASSLIENMKFKEGAKIFRQLLSLYPKKTEILISYSNALYKLKKYKFALKYYNQLFLINPKDINVIINIGIVLISLKDYKKAIYYLKLANNSNHKSSLVFRNLAFCYKELKDFKKSIFYYESSISIDKKFIGSYIALAYIYIDMEDYYLASQILKEGYDFAKSLIKEKNFNNYNEILLKDIGVLFSIMGKYGEAEESLKLLNKLYPNDDNHKMLLSETLLSNSKFKEGWFFYRFRWHYYEEKNKINPHKKYHKPLWNPNLGYENILIWGEQGLGDQILFSTILNDFAKDFKKVFLKIDPRLKNFILNKLDKIEVIDTKINNDSFYDYHIPLGSIGEYCRKKINDFKVYNQQLLIGKEVSPIIKKRRIKCAISWKSVDSVKSKHKSIKLKELLKLLENPYIDFYNIQYTNEEDEINSLKRNHKFNLYEPIGLDIYNDIDGLIKFINTCDFVITVSNSNAHISGAIGKKTFLLLPKVCGTLWYWNNNYNNTNAWYSSVKIFRQKEIGNWNHAIDKLDEYIYNQYIKADHNNL